MFSCRILIVVLLVILILYLLLDLCRVNNQVKVLKEGFGHGSGKVGIIYLVEWGIYGRKFYPTHLEPLIKEGKTLPISYMLL